MVIYHSLNYIDAYIYIEYLIYYTLQLMLVSAFHLHRLFLLSSEIESFGELIILSLT